MSTTDKSAPPQIGLLLGWLDGGIGKWRTAKAREKTRKDRGEWGYIPRTSMLMPRWFTVLLVATVSMNGLAVFSSRWVLEARLEQLAVAVGSSCAHPSQHPTPQKEK